MFQANQKGSPKLSKPNGRTCLSRARHWAGSYANLIHIGERMSKHLDLTTQKQLQPSAMTTNSSSPALSFKEQNPDSKTVGTPLRRVSEKLMRMNPFVLFMVVCLFVGVPISAIAVKYQGMVQIGLKWGDLNGQIVIDGRSQALPKDKEN